MKKTLLIICLLMLAGTAMAIPELGRRAGSLSNPAVGAPGSVLIPGQPGSADQLSITGENNSVTGRRGRKGRNGYTRGPEGRLGFHHNYGNDSMPTTAVPEPATMVLFGLGLAGAGIIRRKFSQ